MQNVSQAQGNRTLTPKQAKLLDILVENGGKDKPLSKYEMLKKAGYSKAIAHEPAKVLESETLKNALEPLIKKIESKRSKALKHMTDKKFEQSNLSTLASVFDTLTKNIQLLSGHATSNVAVSLKVLFDSAKDQ